MSPAVTVTTKVVPNSFFVPENIYKYYSKITITLADGTILNCSDGVVKPRTSDVMSAMWQGGVGEVMSATVMLTNANGAYSSQIVGGETLKIYCDYTDATTLVFSGKIDEPLYGFDFGRGWFCEFHARQIPELVDRTVIASFVDIAANTAVQQILDDNYSGLVNTSEAPTGLPNVTIDFRHANGIAAIKAIYERIGYVCHINPAGKLQAWARYAVTNSDHLVGVGIQLLSVSGLGKNLRDVKNRVIVYGGNIDKSTNVYPVSVAEDESSQSTLWVKDYVINNTVFSTQAETSTKATAELAIRSIATAEGSVTQLGGFVPTPLGPSLVRPGEMITVTVPYCNVDGSYEVRKVSHTLDTSGLIGVAYLTKDDKMLSDLIGQSSKEAVEKSSFQNPNSMIDSRVFPFDDFTDISSSSGVEIVDGNVLLLSGSTSGSIVTTNFTSLADWTKVEWRAAGEQLTNMVVSVSNDGGVTFTTVNPDTMVTFSSSSTQLAVRIVLSSTDDLPSPSLGTFGVYFK